MAARIVQFYIHGRSGNKLTYQIKGNKYFRNNTEINAEEYNKALAYFNANR